MPRPQEGRYVEKIVHHRYHKPKTNISGRIRRFLHHVCGLLPENELNICIAMLSTNKRTVHLAFVYMFDHSGYLRVPIYSTVLLHRIPITSISAEAVL